MRISELAKSAKVGVETVRFYQRKGLLAEPSRDGGMRRYDAADAARLRAIRQAQAAGFTLAQQIAALEHARRSLTRLARDCERGGEGPCPILAAFDGTSGESV